MALTAHCFYCFETLSASFKGIEPPSLTAVEQLWEEHEAFKKLSSESNEALTATEYEEWDGFPDNPGEQPKNKDDSIDPDSSSRNSKADQTDSVTRPGPLKLPSISRLKVVSPTGSSHASTPSALSTMSSRSTLTTATSMTSQSTQSRSYSSCSNVNAEYPLFVTWNVIGRDGQKHLRGCIGTFDPQPLPSGLKSFAISSAFGDSRFSPITVSLLPSLSCSLTLLSSFETCAHALDWDLGTHGIRISFTHRGRRHGATYLPDVAVEQGWTKEETLESLMRKAGWNGSSVYGGVTRRFRKSSASREQDDKNPWEEVADFKTVRYQGLKSNATYSEWREWRKWVESSQERQEMMG